MAARVVLCSSEYTSQTVSLVAATSPQVLGELVALLARASDTDSGAIAVLRRLRASLRADHVAIELDGDARSRQMWTDEGVGPLRQPAREAQAEFPLAAAGESLGVLRVHRLEVLSRDEHDVLGAVADLFASVVARDTRMRDLERQITARVREIAEQRAFIERVVDSLPVGLYVVDREYRIHAWNHKRETGLQGVSRTDAIGRTIFEVLHRQPAALLKQEFDEVFASGRLQQFQMESTAFGDVRTFRISKIPMRMDGDTVTHVITIGEDVTDWKAAIDRTAQSEKLAALGQLAAGVMHEINNPLATIAACAESMQMQRELAAAGTPISTGSSPDELLHIIDLEVQRCKKIVNSLLDFSRPKPAQRETLDLNAVVQQGMFLLQHHPKVKRVRMVTELDSAEPLLVDGDADQLVQVLIALTINAMDATPDGARVVVRTRRDAQGELREGTTMRAAMLEVSDDGPGIPRALQTKIFEPFFTTKAPGQGTGLGLAVCYGIVNDHAGQLEVISPEGQGATFRVSLPMHEFSA